MKQYKFRVCTVNEEGESDPCTMKGFITAKDPLVSLGHQLILKLLIGIRSLLILNGRDHLMMVDPKLLATLLKRRTSLVIGPELMRFLDLSSNALCQILLRVKLMSSE